MTNLLRIAILAALTASAVSLSPVEQTAAAATQCNFSKDCPPGFRCKITHRPHHKDTGICVRVKP